MSNLLECLCHTNTNSEGRKYTSYYANVANCTPEETQAIVDKMRLDGKIEIRLLSWEDYQAIELQEEMTANKVNQPELIDADHFKQMLNVLPPSRWQSTEATEIFYMPEAITGNLYSFYVRMGAGNDAKYYKVNALSSTTNSEILGFCAAA